MKKHIQYITSHTSLTSYRSYRKGRKFRKLLHTHFQLRKFYLLYSLYSFWNLLDCFVSNSIENWERRKNKERKYIFNFLGKWVSHIWHIFIIFMGKCDCILYWMKFRHLFSRMFVEKWGTSLWMEWSYDLHIFSRVDKTVPVRKRRNEKQHSGRNSGGRLEFTRKTTIFFKCWRSDQSTIGKSAVSATLPAIPGLSANRKRSLKS